VRTDTIFKTTHTDPYHEPDESSSQPLLSLFQVILLPYKWNDLFAFPINIFSPAPRQHAPFNSFSCSSSYKLYLTKTTKGVTPQHAVSFPRILHLWSNIFLTPFSKTPRLFLFI